MGNRLYKGFVQTKGKKPLEKLKGRSNWKTYDEVKDLDGFAGILADDTILIDIDDAEQSEIMMNIVEDLQIDCRVYQTSRGRHFLFKNHQVSRNRTHVPLAIGLTADIKCGSRLSYEVIKVDGEERFCEWGYEYPIDADGQYQELPKWLCPVAASTDFIDMNAGDGRNQALFNYILTLTANDFSIEETREAIRILNKYVFKEPLSDEELEVILRDEAFQKPVFFMGSTFQFDKFANHIMNTYHIRKLDGRLCIYQDGIYKADRKSIEKAMIENISNLSDNRRKEVLKWLDIMADELEPADVRYIAFNNGIYDMVTNQLMPFSPDIAITNKIPWNYTPGAYSELTDRTLNRLSCNDHAIRLLLEECIGYCFHRNNNLQKAFILTGDKSNGKSTFLDCIKAILGNANVSALDLKELGDKFSKASLHYKLANVGDDISDEFIGDVSLFKKITAGNEIEAEFKGQDKFKFVPYAKLIFSANDIPRMKDRTGAALRRLVIIPFNATFRDTDSDYDPNIGKKLVEQDSIEYLITLGIAGLNRIITNRKFTISEKVEAEKAAYDLENNPLLGFIEECGEETILNESTADVYKRYQIFCADNGFQPGSNITFSKNVNRILKTEVKQKKINGKKFNIFIKVQ